MRSNKEIRAEAWMMIWRRGNLFKLVGCALLHLFTIGVVFCGLNYTLYGAIVYDLTAETIHPFAELFLRFAMSLFVAVAMMGLNATILRIANDETGIFRSTLLGYAYPFRAFFAEIVKRFVMFALAFPLIVVMALPLAYCLKGIEVGLLLWLSLGAAYLILVAYVLAISYRYRLMWYLKAETPTSGAFEALRMSVKMIDGYKMRLFKFDMSYWLASLLVLIPIVGGIIFVSHWAVGSAIFYRELKAEGATRDAV